MPQAVPSEIRETRSPARYDGRPVDVRPCETTPAPKGMEHFGATEFRCERLDIDHLFSGQIHLPLSQRMQ